MKSFKYVERVVCNVPILKLKDAETGISADICFNREDGYKGIISVLHMQVSYPELRPLYFVLKAYLRERNNLDQTIAGGVCSYMLINMIVYYLQGHYKESLIRERVEHSWNTEKSEASADLELHHHLFRFFKLYGCELD